MTRKHQKRRQHMEVELGSAIVALLCSALVEIGFLLGWW